MPKDTKSLDNNKAPACESRGFVHKKEGVHFDKPSCLLTIGLQANLISHHFFRRVVYLPTGLLLVS